MAVSAPVVLFASAAAAASWSTSWWAATWAWHGLCHVGSLAFPLAPKPACHILAGQVPESRTHVGIPEPFSWGYSPEYRMLPKKSLS